MAALKTAVLACWVQMNWQRRNQHFPLMCCSLQANAALTQQLADHEQLLHALRDEASEMSLRLLGAQESLAAKDNLIEQLKAVAVAVRARTRRSGRQCMVMCITALTSMLHMFHASVKHNS
jgi:hypothetical protein